MAEANDLKCGNISREILQDELKKYLNTDTLIYWEPKGSELRLNQEKYWGSALTLFSSKMNIPSFQTTDTLLAINQDDMINICFERFLNGLNDYELASISHLVKATKSAILPWGLFEGVFVPEEIAKMSLVEIDYQAKKWGQRKEYHEFSEIVLKKKALTCSLFFKNTNH